MGVWASQRFELSREHLEAVHEGTANAFTAVTLALAALSLAESVYLSLTGR